MSFEKNFCPSPWFHMRINNSGSYEYCRWQKITGDTRVNFVHNIKNQTPEHYFQNTLAPIRKQLLNGQPIDGCESCYIMEQNNKVSGRQRQLLKVGVLPGHFQSSLASSTFREDFDYSYANNGITTRTPQDWQIDLGNYCNGACVFCYPEASSKLASEYKKLGIIDQLPANSWCDDERLVEKLVQSLISSRPKYLHFIGGETLITPGFKKILQAVVDSGKSTNTTIGFTTNLTVWDDSIVDLLKKFEQVNLGLSVETLTPVNDYVRWPSQLKQTHKLLDRWVELAKKLDWLIQLRITPTCLSVHEIVTVYDYAWQHHLAVESCNFLYRPEFLRIEVLPIDYREQVKLLIDQWITQHQVQSTEQIINTRDPSRAREQVVQDAQSYLYYLTAAQDESYRLPDLINFLKKIESNRNNSILDYIPQYEQLFRSAGY